MPASGASAPEPDLQIALSGGSIESVEGTPAEFLGGVQDMPAGPTACFTATLEPGRYAGVMEAPTARRMVREFTVE